MTSLQDLLVSAITFVIMYGLYLIYWHRYEKHVVNAAENSVKTYNESFQTDYTYLEFRKIERRNPGWLLLSPEKQNEMFRKHGVDLFFVCLY